MFLSRNPFLRKTCERISSSQDSRGYRTAEEANGNKPSAQQGSGRAVNCSVHPLTYSWLSLKGFENVEEGVKTESSWRLEELD